MILLTARNLARQFAGGPVLDGVSFEVRPGDRIGLVGPNGAGKTTLLNILAGLDEADRGRVERHPSARVALLQQEPDFQAGRSLFDEAALALAPLFALHDEAERAAHALAAAASPDERRRLERRYDHLQHELLRLDAFHPQRRVEEVLDGLGFSRNEWQRPVETFSGGQQSRLLLAKLLLAAPEVMLLDEPSNHLDIAGTTWLEDYLTRTTAAGAGPSSDAGQALIVVSHDRYFLDKVTNRTLELFAGRVEAYAGNFSGYQEQRAERLEVQRRTFERQRAYVAAQEEFIRRNHYGQKSRQAKDREKKLARVERVEAPREIEAPPMGFYARYRDEPVRRSGDVVIDARGVGHWFDRDNEDDGGTRVSPVSAHALFTGLDLEVRRGDRLGILGPNGSGKTTLLRILLGELPPRAGTVRLGHGVQVGYYDQQLASLPADATVLDAVRPALVASGAGTSSEPRWDDPSVRDLVARFGLVGDIVYQRVRELSGGERSRAALARLAASKANLLVLDEPTNHLDLWARGRLEESLAEFDGTAVFVSHDRYFLNRVATRLVVLGGGRARVIEGNYELLVHIESQQDVPMPGGTRARPALPKGDHRWLPPLERGGREGSRRDGAAQDAHSAAERAGPRRVPGPERRVAPHRGEPVGQAPAAGKRRKRPRRKPDELEAEIVRYEEELKHLEAQLAHPETHRDGRYARRVRDEYDALQAKLADLYEHWEEAVENG